MEDNYYKTKNMKKLEKKLLEEVNRFREINKYTAKLLKEQEALPADVPPPAEEVPGEIPPAPGGEETIPPPPGDEGAIPAPEEAAGDVEEIDITDLVNMTKSIKKDIDDNKTEHGEVLNKMGDVFSKLNDLETKLAQMDSVLNKIDELGNKVENMREKTPEEKLELRSLDSYPFNQNPQQFFAKKQDEMRNSGKNEYVITKQDIDTYSLDSIKDSFNPENEEDEFSY